MTISFKKWGSLGIDSDGKVASVEVYVQGSDGAGRLCTKSDSIEYEDDDRLPKEHFTTEVLEGMIPEAWEGEITEAIDALPSPVVEQEIVDL